MCFHSVNFERLELQKVLGGWISMGLMELVDQVVQGKEVNLKMAATANQYMRVSETCILLEMLCLWVPSVIY